MKTNTDSCTKCSCVLAQDLIEWFDFGKSETMVLLSILLNTQIVKMINGILDGEGGVAEEEGK